MHIWLHHATKIASVAIAFCLLANASCAQKHSLAPDIRSIEPDLKIPELSDAGKFENLGSRKGKRFALSIEILPNKEQAASDLKYIIYYPTDFDPEKTYPVIVEFAGNGGYQNKFGDASNGTPEGSNLGYGMSAGKEFIWVCIPFVHVDSKSNKPVLATQWWGNRPEYDPKPTVDYCKQVVAEVCEKHRGDKDRIVLAGFSRGAIACNFIGLYDDEIAALWSGFVPFSHYDGVRDWSLPQAGTAAATERLKRLKGRPQFICSESPWGEANLELDKTRKWIESTEVKGDFTFQSTGFRNHNDAWVLRPSPARDALRAWLKRVLSKK